MNPHVITIVNVLNIRGRETLFKTSLRGVHYQDKQGVKLGDVAHLSSNEGYVQIPHSVGGYIDYDKWLELDDKVGFWTINEGDYIIKGDHSKNDDIKNASGLRSISSFENIDYGIIIPGHFGVYLK